MFTKPWHTWNVSEPANIKACPACSLRVRFLNLVADGEIKCCCKAVVPNLLWLVTSLEKSVSTCNPSSLWSWAVSELSLSCWFHWRNFLRPEEVKALQYLTRKKEKNYYICVPDPLHYCKGKVMDHIYYLNWCKCFFRATHEALRHTHTYRNKE